MLVELKFNGLIGRWSLPDSEQIPAACALRSLLALKLFGNARHSHVMSGHDLSIARNGVRRTDRGDPSAKATGQR
jgi:hypothetical protein